MTGLTHAPIKNLAVTAVSGTELGGEPVFSVKVGSLITGTPGREESM
jgi:hypothetical protein